MSLRPEGLRLVADDLTGALDSACAFARPDDPVAVAIPSAAEPIPERLFALSTESRALAVAEAVGRVEAATAGLAMGGGSSLWFKKVDSVLRGHPVAETVAMHRAGGFALTVFAPAFPAQGRVTRGGQHWASRAAGAPLAPVGPALPAAFAQAGLSSRTLAAANPPSGPWPAVLVIDAECQRALDARVAALRAADLPAPVLWAGAGGLAQALGGQGAVVSVPPLNLFVVGTNHPVSQGQADRLRQVTGITRRFAGAASGPTPFSTRPLLVQADPASSSSAAVEAALRRELAMHRALTPPRGVFVTGGDTLSVLLDGVGATRLWCEGRVADGVPLSRIAGGPWDGVPLVSKSGGFGTPDLLARWMDRGSSVEAR